MIYYLGALLLATYISTSAALPPCVCTRDLKPVCGTDGTTYNNECLLDCARTRGQPDLAVQSRGRCLLPGVRAEPGSCICTLELMPVCGSDGRTYPNECAMDCEARARSAEIVKVHRGECRQKRDVTLPEYPCICTMDYRPVCASDGNTYPNECAMDCEARARSAEIVKVHRGECRQKRDVTLPEYPCICTMDYRPVCASDGKSYPNECAMDCQARGKSLEITKIHDGECRPETDTLADNCICTFDYRPVCASDGKSYPNECAMDCAARAKSLELVKVNDGVCRPKRDTVKVAKLDPCVCTKEKRPVCGTDGHTYSNECILRCAKQAKADLDIHHRGSCENEGVIFDIPRKHDPCTCEKNLEPVCGTNGETYPNECLMRCAGAQFERPGPCDGVLQTVVVADNP